MTATNIQHEKLGHAIYRIWPNLTA